MRRRVSAVFLDAGLLVLLIVGTVGRDRIERHRRTKQFTAEDFDLLVERLTGVDVLITPHTLTEASNLLAQHGEPDRSRFLLALRALVEDHEERTVSARIATSNSQYRRLGLTDAVLLEAVSEEAPVLTSDQQLYRAALAQTDGSAVNFYDLP